MADEEKGLDFEESLIRIENLLHKLENDPNTTLKEAVSSYEDGIKLILHCKICLTTAKQQVEQLIEKDGDFVRKPFLATERTE